MSIAPVTATNPATISTEVLVLAAQQTTDGIQIVHGQTKNTLIRDVHQQLSTLRAQINAGSTHHVVPAKGKTRRVLVIGLDGELPITHLSYRDAAATAMRELLPAGKPHLWPSSVTVDFDLDEQAVTLYETTLGALLGRYRYNPVDSAVDASTVQIHISSSVTRTAAHEIVERAQIVAHAVNTTRDLVNTPPNVLFPERLAEIAIGQTKGTKIKAEVWDEARLVKENCGGILAVGQGSTRGPRLVKLTYRPRKATQHIALVGKGITFDSGGLSLKPAKSMETMKSDMAGAAAVLSILVAAERLRLPVALTGWLCLAENMPSGRAQRPSDVITMRNGSTVEVLNTDAEGRLVLADGLVAAVEEQPDVVIDIATLTGAQVVALGTQVSAVMGSENIRDSIVNAADQAGEHMWPMPLPQYLRASLKSQVADLANIGERFGGMLVAALFLKEFVGETAWAHLDIAGPSFNEGSDRADTPSGGTGVAVRTILTYLQSLVE